GVATFSSAADEATHSQDEALRLDAAPGGEGRQGFVRRFPIGPVGAITPFNFPLNLVAHKLAPAIAAGCPVVLKPAPQTPITALLLAELIAETAWPQGALSVLPLDNDHAAPIIEDPRLRMLSFTGSVAAGWALRQRAGAKQVMLELGGNAGCIIHTDADLALAAARCAAGGFAYAGQSCISVQRLFVHDSVYQTFLDIFVPLVQDLRVGHPLDERADLSSLIDDAAAQRVATWLLEARSGGAQALVGGELQGRVVEPTVLINAAADLKVNSGEVFAPVVTVQTYTDFADALRRLNDSQFGLQAGVFTRDIGRAFQAFEQLEVGGVLINDVPTWRSDLMPYGGLKHSGLGREGVKYAIEAMTEPKLLVINT
ncbi:MAG: aldehyde dehydrogenase family protein, partial [Roseiflexaceae bacterium]|nr:aldehyde dehydrogenase family protein [Roseiflexaceae bacterium]